MGLFSRKTVISVSSVIYPLGEDPDKVPDVVVASAITASLRHTNVNQAIKASIFDGVGVKLSQGFNYAARSYYAGMPKGLPSSFKQANDPLLKLLCEEYLKAGFPGSLVVVTANTISYANDYDTVVQDMISAAYDYDFFQEEVTVAHGAIHVGAVLTLTGPFVDDAHPGDVGYHLVFTNTDTSTVTIDEWYDNAYFTDAGKIQPRILMEFTVDGGISQRVTYSAGGSDHRLNIYLRALQTPTSGTFPTLVLKKDNVYLDDNAFTGSDWASGEAWKTSKAYAYRLGLNLPDFMTKIKANANADDIDFAFIQPGTMITSPSKAIIKYHFNYFNQLRLTMGDNKTAFDTWVTNNAYPANSTTKQSYAQSMPTQSIRLADPDTPESSLDVEIAWRYISYEVKSGVIDEYAIECGAHEITKARWPRKGIVEEEYDTTKLYLRKALTSTTYAELTVCGLWHENYVYKGHSVQSAVWDMFNNPTGDFGTGFIIPLDFPTFISLSPRERLQLGQEAFHIVFNCYVARKQKWYETGIFKVVLVIISIVVIVLSWGTAAPWVTATYSTLSTALIAAGVAITVAAAIAAMITALILVVGYVGVSFLAKEAGNWAADTWGPLWGALVQIGVTIALTYGTAAVPGAPAMAPTSLAAQVAVGSSYVLTGLSSFTQFQYAELLEQAQQFQAYLNSPTDALQLVQEKIQEMFPDLSIAQQAILPHRENMDEFLGRTLTTTDGLTGRLLLPISHLADLTLTPRLT